MSSGFWSMGGYARYVWPCIVLALLVLAWNLWAAHSFREAAIKRARRSLEMSPGDST